VASRDRRPPRTRLVGSDPIPIASLGTRVDDRSVEDRADNSSGRGQVTGLRKRGQSSEPLPLSVVQWLEAKACFGPLWKIADELEQEIGEHMGAGRPRECSAAEILLFESASWDLRSFRAVHRLYADPGLWQRIVATVAEAWPEHPERRLSPRGPTRSQYARFRKEHLEFEDAVERLRVAYREISASVAETVSMCDPSSGSLTHPAMSNLIAGDGTWIQALYNTPGSSPHVDTETGEVVQRRHDPDAIPHYSTSQTCGRELVFAIARNPHKHERVILDLDFRPVKGTTDATVFCDMALHLFDRLPGTQGILYDMAIHAADTDRILDTGRHAMSKVSRTSTGRPAHVNLGEHTFRLADGTTSRIPISALDGTPTLTIVIEGEPNVMPLVRRQNKTRPNRDGTTTLYGIWLVPRHPAVPKHQRGATVMIRHSSTPYERKTNTRRTRALRSLPESDLDFKLFGRREDNESTHHHLKERLPNGRARCVGLTRQRINLYAYQLHTAVTTLVAWHYRTGGDLTPWFGRWRPPSRRRRALAA
jgi:hypothetical protein